MEEPDERERHRSGLQAPLRRLKRLEDDNRKLKQLLADLSLDKHVSST